MCVICVELVKNKMTVLEAERNLLELRTVPSDGKTLSHYFDLYDAIINADYETLDRVMELTDVDSRRNSF